MKTNRKFLLGLLALIILCACARVSQENAKKALVPTVPLKLEDVSKFIKRKQATVRVGNRFGYASGFFADRNKVATNVHVIARFAPILVKSFDEEAIWDVEGVTAFDVENDLVILKVKGAGTPLPLADSDALRIGEPVFAVGNSDGEYKITEGTVHSVRNSDKWIRIKMNTSPGSSGSAILNSEGQVIGVDTLGDPFYSYAIPSNALKVLLERSGSTEPLTQWQKRRQISAYYYMTQANHRYNAERYAEAIVDLNKALQLNSESIQKAIELKPDVEN